MNLDACSSIRLVIEDETERPLGLIEIATITCNGRSRQHRGVFICRDYARAYLSDDSRSLLTWGGTPLSYEVRVVRTTVDDLGEIVYQIEARLFGIWYSGRCNGPGYLWRGQPLNRAIDLGLDPIALFELESP